MPLMCAPKALASARGAFAVLLCGLGGLAPLGRAAEAPARCAFDVRAGAAERTLKVFSEQSGRSLILATSVTAGVRTCEVRGEFRPCDALARMLAGTGLIGIEDPKNGAFTVRRPKDGSETGADGRGQAHPPVAAKPA